MYKKYPYREVFEITEFEGMYNFWYQTLVGDLATDNIMGCGSYQTLVYKSGKRKDQGYTKRVGVGPKAAHKILQDCENEYEMYTEVCHAYEAYYEDSDIPFEMAIVENAQLLYMVRSKDENGELVMWAPPC